MKINGQDILRSEFEYFYDRNNQGEELTKKTLSQYADLFINFKLKVEAAKAEGIDKTEAFLSEFKEYRDLQAEDWSMDNKWLESMARQTFENSQQEVGPKGLYQIAAITLVPEGTSREEIEATEKDIDVLAARIDAGENFRDLAAKYSMDNYAGNGGRIGWYSEGELPKDLADIIFDLDVNEVSEPVLTSAGWQLFTVLEKQGFGSFEEHKAGIYDWMKEGGFYDRAKLLKAREAAEELGWEEMSDSAVVERFDSSLEEIYPEFGLISKEFYDGLLMFEISNRKVWDAALADTASLVEYFEKHIADYKYEKPVFKGILLFCKNINAYLAVESRLEDKTEDEWVPAIIEFNKDSVQVRVMRGPFTEGDNVYADKVIFGKEDSSAQIVGFPSMHSKGHLTDRPESWTDVSGQVVADYQDMLEREWVASLRKTYKYKVNKKVLSTVKNHQ